MKYYLIAGEASGDLHAAHLIKALRAEDSQAQFRCVGGEQMLCAGGTLVRHYRELAFMGFIPVLLHLRTILRALHQCKADILHWQPDAVVLVDYPGFNLRIARFVRQHTDIPVYYYIAPKLWAWKEYRIKNIRRDVDELFSILPFEVDFFEGKHHYPIHYVGNPTAQEVVEYQAASQENQTPCPEKNFSLPSALENARPVIALLAGSRRQEIKDNLPAMLEASAHLADRYDLVVAGAPGIEPSFYDRFLRGAQARLVRDRTYALLATATAALVTSGTATLETALFRVPQVVCYRTPLPHLVGFLRRRFLHVPFVSLVNLIAGREVVPERVAESFSVTNIRASLEAILPGSSARETMLQGYGDVQRALGDRCAPATAARIMVQLLKEKLCQIQNNG